MKYLISKFLDSALRAIGIKSVNGQFMVSYLLIFLFASLTVLSLYFTMSASAETINIAGRQRMLSQRLAKEAMMVAQGVEQRAVMEKTMQLFERSHAKLLVGDATTGLVAPATAEIGTQLKHVGTLWSKYKTIVKSYLDDASKDNLQQLQKMSPVVLKEMNKAVTMMAAASNADLHWQQLFSMVMAAGILLMVLISSVFGMSWLMAQINLVKEHLDGVGNGDFSQKITVEYSDNEIGSIFDSYNRMLEQIGGIVQGVQRLSESVSTQTEQLAESVTVTERSVMTQNSEIDMVATAMNEMSATVGEVANNANQAAQSADDADQAAQNGQLVVDKTMGYIKNVASELSEAVEVMQQLDNDSQEIDNVLTVITGIADQTNLLALNAAIEAARAGEQGRGFAVVADEVRTLARRTQESTEEIQKIIERLQKQSNKAVAVMESSTQQAQESANQATEVEAALQHIVTAVDAISQMNTQIATAAEEQSQVAHEMDRNITNISTAANETAQVAGDVRAGTDTINHQVQQLHDMVAELKV